MEINNKFIFNKQQNDLELKLESDDLTLKEQIQNLQDTIKKLKTDVIDYNCNVKISKVLPSNNENIFDSNKVKIENINNTNNYTGPSIPYKKSSPKKNFLAKKNKLNEGINKNYKCEMEEKQTSKGEVLSDQDEYSERKNLNHSRNDLDKTNKDEIRFSFNNVNNNICINNENHSLPNNYLYIESNGEFEKIGKKTKNAGSKNNQDKFKEKLIKTVENDKNPVENTNDKIFNFTDSSDNDDNNFFSSPILSNQNNSPLLNQNLYIKENRNNINKSPNTFIHKESEKKQNTEKFKRNHKKEGMFYNDTSNNTDKYNITKNSSKENVKSNLYSPKNNNLYSPKNTNNLGKLTNHTKNVAKSKKTLAPKKTRSKSNTGKKIIKRKSDEKYIEIKENEKLKQEIKKLKEENKQLKTLLEKEKSKTEKFNNLAEEFIKFYE